MDLLQGFIVNITGDRHVNPETLHSGKSHEVLKFYGSIYGSIVESKIT